MDITQLKLHQLRYFIAVAEELHFRKAAEKLFITQPGLSRQIQDLESNLEVVLFHRTKKSVYLTDAGNYFYNEVIRILNQIELSARNTQLISTGETGEIRIGFVGSAMHSILPDLLSMMNERFPGMHSILDQIGNKEQIEGLLHNRLDIGFVRSELIPDELESKQVYEECFCLVLPEQHKINAENFKHMGQLRDENFILFSQGYSYDYFHLVMSIFDDQGFVPRVSHRSVHASTIFHLVENGMGVAIIPASLQKGFDLKVKFINLEKIRQRTVLHAVWKKDNRNPALQRFLEVL